LNFLFDILTFFSNFVIEVVCVSIFEVKLIFNSDMKKIKLYTVLALILALTGITLVTNSCGAPKPCKAIITIMDTTGRVPQSGATVKLFATINGNTADLKAQGVSGSDGTISFEFKLPCILDIDAQMPSCTSTPPTENSTTHVVTVGKYCHGKAIIKLEEGTTAQKIVYLKD
jgi:hypothetical protein